MHTFKNRMIPFAVACLLSGGFTVAQAATGTAVFWGPTPYLSSNDIPAGFYLGGSPTLLDNLEDGSLDTSISASNGSVYGPTGIADSVDADDGSIDGFGTAGRSWFSGTVTFTYAGSGPLPTAFGLVWTDGSGTITFSATDALSVNRWVHSPLRAFLMARLAAQQAMTTFSAYSLPGVSSPSP